MPPLLQVYYTMAGLGFTFLAGTFLLGHFGHNEHGVEGEGGGNVGDTDFPGDSHGDPGDFGGDHGAGDFGGDHGDAGDFGDHGDGGDFGDQGDAGDIGDHGDTDVTIERTTAVGRSSMIAARPQPHERAFLLFLRFISPSTIATFMFCFGVVGVISATYLPWLGLLTLFVAFFGGIVGYNIFSSFTANLNRRMHSSYNFSENDFIGRPAEVTVTVSDGKIGEIACTVGRVRHTISAKCAPGEGPFTGMSRVIVTEIVNGVAIVESATDFDGEGDVIRIPQQQTQKP